MRTYNLAFIVRGEKDIIFQSTYAHIEQRENGLFCSLEGEYLRNGQHFDPPMRYKIEDAGVPTSEIVAIITPIYRYLILERSLGSKR